MSTSMTVIDPVMGEALDLATAAPERLGQLLLDVRECESKFRELKTLVNEELHARFDRDRLWTLHAGDLKITGKSDAPVATWDVEGLLEELDTMVAEGVLSAEAAARAVQPRTEYVTVAAGIAALLKSPEIAARIEGFRTMSEPTGRRVSVSRG